MGFNISDIGKKLGNLKDYASLIVPVIIIVFAIIFLVVSSILGGKLLEKVEAESLSNAKRIKGYQDVPPKEQWQVEAAFQASREQDANQISNLVIETTMRELLKYKMFPEPNDKSTLIFSDFGHKYQLAVEKLIESVNGRDCPSETDIEQHLGRNTTTSTPNRGFSRTSSRRNFSSANLDAT